MPSIILSLIYLNSSQKINLVTIDKYKGTYKNIINDIKQKNENENNLGLKRWAYYGLYSKSLVIFKNNKFFGTTYKSFRKECSKSKYDKDYSNITNGLEYVGCSTHPHNIYLEILSEQGIFGFIIFIYLIYSFFKLSNTISYLNNNYYKIF